MAATLQDLKEWFDEGVKAKATHMIVVCDTFDYEDYPVYVKPGQDARAATAAENDGEHMKRVMEVYNLSKPWPKSAGRCWDF